MAKELTSKLVDNRETADYVPVQQKIPKLKLRWKILIALIVAVPVVALWIFFSLPRESHVGGAVEVDGKWVDHTGWYIVVNRNWEGTGEGENKESTETAGLYSLAVTKEEYQSIPVGEVLWCFTYINNDTRIGRLASYESYEEYLEKVG